MLEWFGITDFCSQITKIVHYNDLSFVLYMGSAAAWLVVYVATFYYIIKRQQVQIPAFAVALNVGWEIAWTMLPHAIGSRWLWYLWIPGVLIDFCLLYSVLRYGYKQNFSGFIARHFRVVVFSTMVLTSTMFFLLAVDCYDLPMGVLSAMVYSVLMAAWFVGMESRLDESQSLSGLIGWFKMIGDLCLAAYCWQTNPGKNVFILLGLMCLVYDVIYIYRVKVRNIRAAAV